PDRKGVQAIRRERNDSGHVLREAFLDAKGEFTLGPAKVSSFDFTYDAFGNQTERRCAGTKGEPVLHKDGFFRAVSTYDGRGNEIECAYLGTDDRPITHRTGVAIYRQEFDDRGNGTKWSGFGRDGKPTLHRDGYSSIEYKFDDRGHVTEFVF